MNLTFVVLPEHKNAEQERAMGRCPFYTFFFKVPALIYCHNGLLNVTFVILISTGTNRLLWSSFSFIFFECSSHEIATRKTSIVEKSGWTCLLFQVLVLGTALLVILA